MNRRDFLRSAGVVCASVPSSVHRLFAERAVADGWRTFEVTTRVDVLNPSATTRVWLPTALTRETPYQRTISTAFVSGKDHARIVERSADALGIVTAEFPPDATPQLIMRTTVATKPYAVDLTARRSAAPLSAAMRDHFLRPTKLLPTDGIVKSTAVEITRTANTDVDKARAIYDWVVENTSRDPKTRGCGVGDIRSMLATGNLGGKCADLNALYVGLARAAGLPARDVYGIRIAKSELGYKSLGAASETITKAQHCRAEVFLSGHGWVPVDPADVRKVALEEPPGNRSLDDEMVSNARARLFGSWEMNWMAYNYAHDVVLPGARRPPVGFLMYPQAETDRGSLDSLDPDSFKYEIVAREAGVEHTIDDALLRDPRLSRPVASAVATVSDRAH